MGKYRFSYSERYALWEAYDGRCFYCEKPLDFCEMTVDHILPEWLNEHPAELMRLRQEYEIDASIPGFQINDFANWVPAHFRKCNLRKGSEILPKRMALLLLHEVHRHLPVVHQKLNQVVRSRARSRAFGSLSIAVENKHLTISELREFVSRIEREQYSGEPLVVSFGLIVGDVARSGMLPRDIVPEYAYLCDWLELDLVKRLRAAITTPFHYTQPSERSGEGLSVRIVFPNVNTVELDMVDLP